MFLAFLVNPIVKKTLLLIVVAQIHNVANRVNHSQAAHPKNTQELRVPKP